MNKLRLLLLTLALLSVAALARGSPAAAAAADGPVIVVLGDSLSAEYGLRRGTGWVELMRDRLAKQGFTHQVVNASISGETTAGGRSRIGQLLATHRPAIAIVELGGNDALRGLNLAASTVNLRAIAGSARRAGAAVLLLGMQVPPNYGRAYSERFAGIFATAARSEHAALVPFFLARVAERDELFQADRIHPTEAAQPLLLDNVWPALEPLLRATARR